MAIDPVLDGQGEERGLGAGLLGNEGCAGKAEAEPSASGRAGPTRPGQERTAGSCQTHSLILRLHSLCLGDFQLAIVSFTDGFAVANYKFVSNSFSDASKKKMPYPCGNYKFITNSVIQLNVKQIHYQLHDCIEYQVSELHRQVL